MLAAAVLWSTAFISLAVVGALAQVPYTPSLPELYGGTLTTRSLLGDLLKVALLIGSLCFILVVFGTKRFANRYAVFLVCSILFSFLLTRVFMILQYFSSSLGEYPYTYPTRELFLEHHSLLLRPFYLGLFEILERDVLARQVLLYAGVWGGLLAVPAVLVGRWFAKLRTRWFPTRAPLSNLTALASVKPSWGRLLAAGALAGVHFGAAFAAIDVLSILSSQWAGCRAAAVGVMWTLLFLPMMACIAFHAVVTWGREACHRHRFSVLCFISFDFFIALLYLPFFMSGRARLRPEVAFAPAEAAVQGFPWIQQLFYHSIFANLRSGATWEWALVYCAKWALAIAVILWFFLERKRLLQLLVARKWPVQMTPPPENGS
jgi:hypothetical protein